MALPVPNPKAMLANRRYDSDSFRLHVGHCSIWHFSESGHLLAIYY